MAKVFRLFVDKDLEHWQDRGEAYSPTIIDRIPNPDGDSKLDKSSLVNPKEPTSIPSPFARIDLIKTAFKYVGDKYLEAENAIKGTGTVSGDTIYHKLVSDSLDIGILFFNHDLLPKLAIHSWDKNADLRNLINSNNDALKLYGETLNLYLNQDKETYNFDILNRIFVLSYDYKVIGGTSPSTLFFTSGNDLSKTNITIGNDTLFDKNLKPLYERDPDFQKYIYLLFATYPFLQKRMEDLHNYMTYSLEKLKSINRELYNYVKELERKDVASIQLEYSRAYEPFGSDINTAVEVIGCRLLKKKIRARKSIIESESKFLVESPKYRRKLDILNQNLSDDTLKRRMPLALQSSFAERLPYTDSSVKWDTTTQVPFFDGISDIDKRILPGQLDEYPYLTVSDFLQPYLIRLIYPINKTKFYDGNVQFQTGDKNKYFVLPLTTKFFDFFDTTDLQKPLPDGRSMLELIAYSGSVEVILRVPVKGTDYITFKRTYENKGMANPNEPDVVNNKGYIVENQFGLTVYPFLKIGVDDNNFYRVMLVDRDIDTETKFLNYDLSFYKNSDNDPIKIEAKKNRNSKSNESVTSNFYVIESAFDYIEVKHDIASGIIVPLFPIVRGGNEEFTFAIDFGTTNTHIEYTLDYSKKSPKLRTIKPFEITANDIQIATLHDPDSESVINAVGAYQIIDLIPHEFLPEKIGKDFEYRFPQRTIIGHHKSIEIKKTTYSLADFNIPFIYEKEPTFRGTKIKTNLKWSNYILNPDDEKKIEAFFDQLMFLIRNKILLNHGSLEQTNLIWFYPSSMIEERRNLLENTWAALFKKYITTSHKPKKLSESIAPFYYFKNKGGIDASDLPVAAIDIGGGTTDIVIYKDNKPRVLTSFHFAANSIFGDAYNGSPEINGFVLKYLDKIKELLEINELQDLVSVLDDITNEQSSEDIAAFFFSIHKQNISFKDMLLRDSELKIVFVIFYAAIIYHLAKLMKNKNLGDGLNTPPCCLTFSGTGSKVIQIADSNSELAGLEKLTNQIFEKVFDVADLKIQIKQHQEPKEITCRGGLLSDAVDLEIEGIKAVLLGDLNNTVIPDKRINYVEAGEDAKLGEVIKEVKAFFKLFFELNTEEFNFRKKFGINNDRIEEFQAILDEKLMQFLKSGLTLKKEDLSGKVNNNVEETFFFYPLVGALNNLALKIVKKQEVKKELNV